MKHDTENKMSLKNENAERFNPCLKEQEQSYQCLSKNNFVQEKCEEYFDNYNTCKKFWVETLYSFFTSIYFFGFTLHPTYIRGKVTKDRRARGIAPYLPDVADREQAKAEYIKKMTYNTI